MLLLICLECGIVCTINVVSEYYRPCDHSENLSPLGWFAHTCITIDTTPELFPMVFQVNVTRFSGDDEDILEDDEPDLDTVMIQHPGAVNRIRVRRVKGLCSYAVFISWQASLSNTRSSPVHLSLATGQRVVSPSLCLSVTLILVTV